MTENELERAACEAARRIIRLEHEAGRTATDKDELDLVFSSARRSRMLDRIVEAIKESFSVHVLASPAPSAPREAESVRHSRVAPCQQHRRDSLRIRDDDGRIFTVCLYCGDREYEAQPPTVEPSPSNEATPPTEAKTNMNELTPLESSWIVYRAENIAAISFPVPTKYAFEAGWNACESARRREALQPTVEPSKSNEVAKPGEANPKCSTESPSPAKE